MVERKVLDYNRAHKGEIDVEKCAKELKMPLHKINDVIKNLRKKGLLKDSKNAMKNKGVI